MKAGSSVDDRLRDIISWGDRVAKYIGGMDFDAFKADLRTQDAVIRCLEVVGEAAGAVLKIAPDFERQYPLLALSRAYRARNRTAHGYGSVDLMTVWRTATVACPALVAETRRVLKERDHGES